MPLAIRWFYSLFVCGHKPVSWYYIIRHFRVIHLEQQTLLTRLWIALLGDSITGSTDLHEFLRFNPRLLRRQGLWCFLSLLCSTPGQIGLMLLALCVRQVTPLVVVQGQTEFALVRAKVVFHKIRILVQIDSLQGELTQPFPAIAIALRPGGDAAAAGFAARTILEVHLFPL